MPEAPSILRVVIVDDEPRARASLRKLLEADCEVELVGECANGREAVEAARAHAPDLMFLDVQMPGMTGLQVLEELVGDERPAVIFTTAYDQYALEAFDEHAVDYLLKPFDDERFLRALTRAKERIRSEALANVGRKVADIVASMGRSALESEDRPAYAERLSVHREGAIELIEVTDIEWIEAADQYIRLHTRDSERLMRQAMGELEKILDPARFVRTHRSAIVALEAIVRLESQSGGTGRVLLRGGSWVPVSRSRIPAIRRLLG